MLKFQDLPEEERREAFRLADEAFRRETETARETKAAIDAAEELGVPAEYLERAAQELQARKIDQVKGRRRRRQLVGTAAVGVALIAGGLWLVRPAPPVAVDATAAQVVQSTGTSATVTPSGNGFTLSVDQLGGGQYFANAKVPLTTSLAGHRKLTFSVQGQGLQNLRVDLENGNERWKGPNVSLSQPRVSLDLNSFTRQERQGDGWTGRVSQRAPGQVGSMVFKVGETINPNDARGTVTITDIRVE